MSDLESPSRPTAPNPTPGRAKASPIPEPVTPRPSTPSEPDMDPPARTVSDAWQETERFARAHPLGVSLGALAAGLAVGLLLGLAIGGE